MTDKRSWEEFRETGLLWWINMILHTFGWSICLEINEGEITDVYPSRVNFKGFDEKTNTYGYKKVSEYISNGLR